MKEQKTGFNQAGYDVIHMKWSSGQSDRTLLMTRL